jgi:hypothetical protein
MRFGILIAAPPGRAPLRYRFNAQDALWLGRYLAAAGPRARGRRRQVAWQAIQRFAESGGASTFSEFVQRRAPSIPRAPWQTLSPRTRALALATTTGRLAPPVGGPRLFVKPAGVSHGAYAPPGPRWGQRAYESEYEYEDAPGEAPPGGGGAPPPQGSNGTQPPIDASNAPDAGAGSDAAPDEDPSVDEPPGAPTDVDTADGNTLTLTPQLIQQVLAMLRRHPRREWRRRFPWLSQAVAGNDVGAQQPQWGGRHWTGRGWTSRPWAGRAWTGRSWTSRRGVVTRRGRPITSARAGARRWHARRPIAKHIRQLARSSRKIGSLRSRRTGRSYPVFGAHHGGRHVRIVTRPRRGMQHEIVLVRSGPLGAERQT